MERSRSTPPVSVIPVARPCTLDDYYLWWTIAPLPKPRLSPRPRGVRVLKRFSGAVGPIFRVGIFQTPALAAPQSDKRDRFVTRSSTATWSPRRCAESPILPRRRAAFCCHGPQMDVEPGPGGFRPKIPLASIRCWPASATSYRAATQRRTHRRTLSQEWAASRASRRNSDSGRRIRRHWDAIGAGVRAGDVSVIGTSTCIMAIAENSP